MCGLHHLQIAVGAGSPEGPILSKDRTAGRGFGFRLLDLPAVSS